MTPRQLTTVRLDPTLVDGLEQLAERDGVSVSEQLRRAVAHWLTTNGVPVSHGPSFDQNVQRVLERWDYLLDRLVLAEDDPEDRAALEVPVGLSPLIPGGRRLGALSEQEYEHLVRLARQLGRQTAILDKAWKALRRDRARQRNKREARS